MCLVYSLKEVKEVIAITNAFQNILNESNCKRNKIWAVDFTKD